MRTRHALVLLAVLGLTASSLVACTSDPDTVTVYSGRGEALVGPVLDDFAAETGIDVQVKYGDSAELALLLSEEGDRSPADVFISQNPGPMGFLESEGLLAPLSTETLELVPENFRGESGQWVGLSARRRVIVYNEDLVSESELPGSVLELTDPAYAGLVGIAPTNGSFQDFVSAMRVELGDEATAEWLAAMSDNGVEEYGNNNAVVEAVSRGEIPIGLVNHYYNLRFLDEDPDLPSRNHYLPADDVGSLLIFAGAAVLEASDNKDNAEELIRYLLSEDAQRYFSEETFEYPLVAGVEAPDQLDALDSSDALTVDYSVLGDDFETTIEMIDDSGLGS